MGIFNKKPKNFSKINKPGSKNKSSIGGLQTKYIAKCVFAIICLIVCLTQIASILSLYFQYPSTVIIIRRTMRKLYVPGITLCNRNRIKRSKLVQSDQSFAFNWSQIGDNLDEERIRRQKMIDRTLRKMMREMTVAEFMSFGHTVNDFIDSNYTTCASDKFNPDSPCRELLNVITTAYDQGNCFTLFHKSKSKGLRELAIPPGFSQVPIKRGRDSIDLDVSEEEIRPNEVIRLKVDFQREEYMTLNEPVLGQLIVHDDNEIPVIRERSFLIEPGHYYEFNMRKEFSHLLPNPYFTDCKEYPVKKTKDYNPFLHNPLSKSDCVIGCMAQRSMDLCGCWPFELPFIKGSLETAQENQMKWCDWNRPLLLTKRNRRLYNLKENQTLFDYCFAIHENKCNDKCNNNCGIKYFKLDKEVRVWPSSQRIEHSDNREYLSRMRNCCAIISIKYWGSDITINEYKPKLQDTEFMSYIGGLLSLWIGFSFLGLYDVLAQVVKYVYILKTKRQKPKKFDKGTKEGYPSSSVPKASYIANHDLRSSSRKD